MVSTHAKRLLALGVLVVGAQVLVQVTAIVPASAAPGMVVVTANSATNSASPKTVRAFCPAGLAVYGGGGQVHDGFTLMVRLTEMQPFFGPPDYFEVTAVEPLAGFSGAWSVSAFVICGNPLPGMEKDISVRAPSSNTFQGTTATCVNSRYVLGSGGMVSATDGGAALQLVRPSGNLIGSYATAREDASGYAASWTVTAFAICVDRIPGQQYQGHVVNGDVAAVACPSGTVAYGAGGGGGTSDGGPVYLQAAFPTTALNGVNVLMTGTPTGGGMVAVATCAN